MVHSQHVIESATMSMPFSAHSSLLDKLSCVAIIKQENLLSFKALLFLLKARDHHPPSNLVATGMDAIHIGLVSRAIVLNFLSTRYMTLSGSSQTLVYMTILWSVMKIETRREILGKGAVTTADSEQVADS
ncbi:hypothetical protein BO82DRAFT_140668 [Aspergillus uvarum CBS 121591]|uniref:Uncharacterized protein n=1 Tax=Aspergillus uvarum CBS 121591 TaxID=1448315 RepID=A0A319CJN7_9EURO|nr:hypothetical protein BO82DRAFT_140668 [Aspergillus uvarum CBS 121591]PYH85865.1 hypothetical protein BO82DRAFT_140668 [Aspergillus uvarum CBS 121591]